MKNRHTGASDVSAAPAKLASQTRHRPRRHGCPCPGIPWPRRGRSNAGAPNREGTQQPEEACANCGARSCIRRSTAGVPKAARSALGSGRGVRPALADATGSRPFPGFLHSRALIRCSACSSQSSAISAPQPGSEGTVTRPPTTSYGDLRKRPTSPRGSSPVPRWTARDTSRDSGARQENAS